MAEDTLKLLLDSDDANLQLASPALVNYYHDFNNRCLWLDCEIDEGNFDLVQAIIRWNQDDVNIPTEERKPIKIFFHSPGGSLDVGEILTSVIKLSRTPVYGIALGMVASAASIVYLDAIGAMLCRMLILFFIVDLVKVLVEAIIRYRLQWTIIVFKSLEWKNSILRILLIQRRL